MLDLLGDYIKDTQSLLGDTKGQFTPRDQLIRWINVARSDIAKITACINTVVQGQAPFGNQAAIGAMVQGAMVIGNPPGAVGPPLNYTITNEFQTIVGQEKYPFSYALPYIQAERPGIQSIIDVGLVAVAWGNLMRTCNWQPWEHLQSYGRMWMVANFTYPEVFSTSGDGAAQYVWIYPPPSVATCMLWVCSCLPAPLRTNADPEAIPEGFREAVKFGAAYYSYLRARPDQGAIMRALFLETLGIDRTATDRGKVPYFY